jgi:CHAT domain-containing protein
MIVILAVLVAQVPQVDSIRALARDGHDSALIVQIRRRPDEAREAMFRLMFAGAGDDSSGLADLAAAQRIAGFYATEWRDSSIVREVARYQSLSRADRLATIAADSILRAGGAAQGSAGIEASLRAYREGLRRFEALGDSAGIAFALVQMSVGLRNAQQYDSAEAYATRSLNLAERIGSSRAVGNAVYSLGGVSWRRRDLPRASELYARAESVFERHGQLKSLRGAQNDAGLIAWELHDLPGARRAFEQALAANQNADDSAGTALVLSNLGGVALEEGNYAEAEADTRATLAFYKAKGNTLWTAVTLRDLGVILVRRGDYPAALAAWTEAAAIYERLGPSPYGNAVDVWMQAAQARIFMGDLQGARAELRRAEGFASHLSGQQATDALAWIASTRGDLAVQLNQLAEAERQYARSRRLAHDTTANGPPLEILLKRHDYRRARVALERMLKDTLDPQNAAMNLLKLGQVDWQLGDTAAARRVFSEALDSLRAVGAAVDEANALARLGDLEAGAGRGIAAESLYHRGLTRLGARSAPAVAWSLHGGLADVLRGRGDLAGAAAELRAAIAEIEHVSGNLQLEEQRSAFHSDKWDPYINLSLVEQARGQTDAAFEASEELRARQMLDLLARGRVRESQTLGPLATREQDLRRRIGELASQNEAAGAAPGMRGAEAATANEALTRAQDQYAELLTEMREANPAYAALVKGEIAPAPAVRAALAPDEALLEYLVGDSTSLVFVVTADSVTALDLHVRRDALTALVDFTRSALGSPGEGKARPAWRTPLRRLYRYLVAPAESSGLLEGKRRLLIAPYAELHYLPFAALVRPGAPEQFLVERYVLEYVPSASVWLRLRDRPQPTKGGGVLALAPRPAALPGSEAEIAAIQRTYGGHALALVGRAASESAFRALAPEREVVHLATHGVLNKHNPLFSFVQLGAGGGEDGRLEVHEVFGLTLHARLLVLSACQTGVGAGAVADVPPGDDWIGLVQGFLYAGAGNVLATLWPVSDVATARLMERFYGKLGSGHPEVEALASAQRAALRDAGTAHPFYWAGFSLVRGN